MKLLESKIRQTLTPIHTTYRVIVKTPEGKKAADLFLAMKIPLLVTVVACLTFTGLVAVSAGLLSELIMLLVGLVVYGVMFALLAMFCGIAIMGFLKGRRDE